MAEAASRTIAHGHHDDWEREFGEREVLIAADNMDHFRIKKYILPDLETFKTSYYFENKDLHQISGYSSIQCSHVAVMKCKKTLLILSQKGLRQLPLELYLAIEKSLQTDEMRLVVLLIDGMTQDDIPQIPWLETASYVKLDDNIHEICMRKLCNIIRRDEPLHTKLPVGNVGRGMAWSHFLGYLKVILPELRNQIPTCKFYMLDGTVCMPVKFYMLLPGSGKGPKGQNNLESLDPRLKFEGQLKIETMGRTFTPNIYSIVDQERHCKYYCCAEIPSAFCALGCIFMDALGKIDPRQLALEVERFYYQMDFLLSHENSRACHDKVVMLPYNDEDKTGDALPGTHLLRACRENLQGNIIQGRAILGRRVPCDRLYNLVDTDELEEDRVRVDVCLICCNCDKQKAQSIRAFLESKQKHVSMVVPEIDGFKRTEQVVRAARWSVLFLSRASVGIMEFWLGELLLIGNLENNQRLLPVLLDTGPDQIPDFIGWVTYITADEPEYMEKLNRIVEGESVTFTTQAPIGNVAEGLVWTFYANYLCHILQDIPKRMRKKLSDLPGVDIRNVKYSTQLFQLVPRSCRCPQKLSSAYNCRQISDEGLLDPVEKTIWGTKRMFNSNMYKITLDNGSHYYFLGEFAKPVQTLYDMHESLIAGLNNRHMEEQAQQFACRLQKVLRSKVIEGTNINCCEVIVYDDETDNLVDMLVKKIISFDNEMQQQDIDKQVGKIHMMIN